MNGKLKAESFKAWSCIAEIGERFRCFSELLRVEIRSARPVCGCLQPRLVSDFDASQSFCV